MLQWSVLPVRAWLGLASLALLFTSETTFATRYRATFEKNPAASVGRLRLKNQECTAFLSGPSQITTAAHCIQYGLDDARFELQYEKGKAAQTFKVKGAVVSGGGYDPDNQLDGTDWAHLEIEHGVGVLGKWLDLSADDTPTGMEISVVSYMANWPEGANKGEYAGIENCVVKDPPTAAKKFCKDLGKGEYSCSFFAHDCELDRDGMDSGAPIVSRKTGKVVGILTGQGHIGTRVFNWGLTVNESENPASNPFFHWLNLRNYVELDRVARQLGKRTAVHAKKDHSMVTTVQKELIDKFSEKSEYARFLWIQHFDTTEGQLALAKLIDQYMGQVVNQFREKHVVSFDIDTSKLPEEKGLREGKKKFSMYYDSKQKPAYSLAFRKPPEPKQVVAVKTYLTSPSNGSMADDYRRFCEIEKEVDFLYGLKDQKEYADYIVQRAQECKKDLNEIKARWANQVAQFQNQARAPQFVNYTPQPSYRYYYVVPNAPVVYQPMYYYYVPARPVYYWIR